MESFPEMTNKVTALVRATGIEDPGRMSGGAGGERPDPEVPERARAGRSPRSTSWRSWPPTTPLPMVRRVRCCVGRA